MTSPSRESRLSIFIAGMGDAAAATVLVTVVQGRALGPLHGLRHKLRKISSEIWAAYFHAALAIHLKDALPSFTAVVVLEYGVGRDCAYE